MPLVRISYQSGKPDSYAATLSDGVHRAMIEAFGIPEDDFFQIVTEHPSANGLRYPDSFLGIDHTEEIVFVQITAAEGRTTEQKMALYKQIASNLARNAAIRSEDVITNLVETRRENWSFGNGEAPFA
jgi:phenylpyruvate tautomerase PptA (4-oxalocrotonate tautomerase family)